MNITIAAIIILTLSTLANSCDRACVHDNKLTKHKVSNGGKEDEWYKSQWNYITNKLSNEIN